MIRIGRKIGSILAGMALAASFAIGFAHEANAGTLYWKDGTSVSHSWVFKDSHANNLNCWKDSLRIPDATMCIRWDRRSIYVRSDRANGYFKLGQLKGGSLGNTYRCQNNNRWSSGDTTWVGCHWDWPRSGCYVARTGHGQSDWYRLSDVSWQECY